MSRASLPDNCSGEPGFVVQWERQGPRLEIPARQLTVLAVVLPVEKEFPEGEEGGPERGWEQEV